MCGCVFRNPSYLVRDSDLKIRLYRKAIVAERDGGEQCKTSMGGTDAIRLGLTGVMLRATAVMDVMDESRADRK